MLSVFSTKKLQANLAFEYTIEEGLINYSLKLERLIRPDEPAVDYLADKQAGTSIASGHNIPLSEAGELAETLYNLMAKDYSKYQFSYAKENFQIIVDEKQVMKGNFTEGKGASGQDIDLKSFFGRINDTVPFAAREQQVQATDDASPDASTLENK